MPIYDKYLIACAGITGKYNHELMELMDNVWITDYSKYFRKPFLLTPIESVDEKFANLDADQRK